MDQCQYLSSCAHTPPLTQQQSTDNKVGLMLSLPGRDRCAVSQILRIVQHIMAKIIQFSQFAAHANCLSPVSCLSPADCLSLPTVYHLLTVYHLPTVYHMPTSINCLLSIICQLSITSQKSSAVGVEWCRSSIKSKNTLLVTTFPQHLKFFLLYRRPCSQGNT